MLQICHFNFVFAGGSVSNMYAMNLARYKYCPDIKEKGLSGSPRLILFTSAEVKIIFCVEYRFSENAF